MTVTDRPTADLTGTTVHHRSCPLCEAACGLEITMRGDEVVRIRGDRDNPFSRGFICPKGSTLKQLHEDPDRLRAPLVRRGDDPATATWDEVSWDEAFAEVERGLGAVLAEHGRSSVAVYFGNPSAHTLAGVLYNRTIARALGSTNVYSASTVDQMPKHVSSGLLFGGPLLIPVPDLDRTQHLILLGANPWESNGSLCTAPDFPGRVKAIQARGGKVVVVDPRRSRTAEEADEHVAVRPGTDAHLLVAMANVLFAEDLVDLGHASAHVAGVDELQGAISTFTPEAVAPICGVDADVIRHLARDLAAAPSAAVYGRIGTHTAEFGTIAAWAVDVLNTLTGNLDQPGGAMFPLAAHDRPDRPGPGRGFQLGRHHSRVRGFGEVNGELPVATLADEIETPGDGQVRALVTVAGNPVVSTPNSGRLDAALASLEFMVSVDIYLNETTRHANVILPAPSPLERSEYPMAFFGFAVRNFAEWAPPILEPQGLMEHETLARLSMILSGQGAGADASAVDDLMVSAVLERAVAADDSPIAGRSVPELTALLGGHSAVDKVVDAMIRTGPYGDWFGAVPEGISLAKLADRPHGIDLGPLQPRLPDLLRTPSGKVELAPGPVLDDLPRLRAALDRPDEGQLLLVGRRHLRSNNSWMHNIDVLVKGKPRCTLQVHPDDAATLGLVDGGLADVASRVGKLTAPVEVTDSIRPGVVSLPHGWGHDLPGVRLGVAAGRGVNSNLLTDGEALDPLSGNAVLNGIPVAVSPA
ncbi:MAG TPA: molybdopterin oxidoreductase family protein [Acidimicrobiales bacterium]|nr:molybdopterin oxidoreductase family protein [Acidimicrobiales bacterium]